MTTPNIIYNSYAPSRYVKLSERDYTEYQLDLWWEEYGYYDYAFGGSISHYRLEKEYHPMLLGQYRYEPFVDAYYDRLSEVSY